VVPVLHVCGSRDRGRQPDAGAEKRYKDLGGAVTVLIEDGKGHFPSSPRDVKPVVDFIVSRQPAANQPPPAPAPAAGP